ncbi:MAG: UDP-N-acetylmuramoyl-L-alanine--D-glutamate ligase [Thermomicrobiales bacterium]
MSVRAYEGVRATIMGLGVLGGGVGVARYLAERGATVTVTDQRIEADLAESISQLSELDITYHLGDHDDRDFMIEGADLVVRNPGVRRDSRYLRLARESGVSVEMEMSLFFRACPSRIIGVTGTKGKTTVTALIGQILTSWNASSFIAGNMGISALEGLSRLVPETPVAIELSSWQLESLDEHHLGPHVSVITNFSEDHLDRYDGFEDYVETKRSIAHHQKADGVAVFNGDDVHVRRVADQTQAVPMSFGALERAGNSAWSSEASLYSRFNDETLEFPLPEQISLRGPHGRLNALAAIAACHAYGVPEHAISSGLMAFFGVENRLEDLGTVRGVYFINDTSATAPIATVSALNLLRERPGHVFLISGGADKKSDLTEFLDVLAEKATAIVLLPGSATESVTAGLEARGVIVGPIARSMEEAVGRAFEHAKAGDTVILSPGLASFGLFRNEFDRGTQFRAARQRLWDEYGS